jgi:hypothetical protein
VGAIGYAIHGLSSKLTAPAGDMTKYPTRFWIPGVAMLAAGHFMHRRPRLANAGIALCGAAGFSIAEGATLAYTIKQNQKTQAAQSSGTTTTTQGLGDGPSIYDAGAVLESSDVGALLAGNEVGEIYSVESELAPAMAM